MIEPGFAPTWVSRARYVGRRRGALWAVGATGARDGSGAYLLPSALNMLQTGLIVGGWDKYEGGKIYGIPLGGTLLEQPFTIGGSGSSYLYGFFDQVWKEGMTQDEAEKLVVKAVSLAIARDGASGGVVRTVTVSTFLIMKYAS
ncbi:hypothetical protein SASPL_129677 [Salvia splendens]|uniref:20S proteasome subunit beta 1 n=1 Tax=Salvia splendens TaxID=180675 RepID=A0A8X8XFG0_SALSN|nr:hypothetical protein SASPL_129677 [Salvia splendens]